MPKKQIATIDDVEAVALPSDIRRLVQELMSKVEDKGSLNKARSDAWFDAFVSLATMDYRIATRLKYIIDKNDWRTDEKLRAARETFVLTGTEPEIPTPPPPSPESVRIAETLDLGGAMARIRTVLKVVHDRDYPAALIFAAQAYVVDLLESVFYLAFKGKSGAGKGTAVESAILLTPTGIVLGNTTPAYLSAVLTAGRTIGIEEADTIIKRSPEIAMLLRAGYRAGIAAGLMVPVGENAWLATKRSLFGPKTFDFHTTLETHLLGRTHVVDMEPDDSVDRAMDAEKKRKVLEPVRVWLANQAEKAMGSWTRDRVEAHWDDPAFRRRVAAMGGSTGREHVIAANMLLVADIMGWDYDAIVKELMANRKTIDEFSDEAVVAEKILSIVGTNPRPEIEISVVDELLEGINNDRHRLRLGPMTPHKLAAVLKEIGFTKTGDSPTYYKAKSGPYRDRQVIHSHPLIQRLAQLAQLAPPHMEVGQMGQMGQSEYDPLSSTVLDQEIRNRLRSRSSTYPIPATFLAKELAAKYGMAEDIVLARIAGISEEVRGREGGEGA